MSDDALALMETLEKHTCEKKRNTPLAWPLWPLEAVGTFKVRGCALKGTYHLGDV